MNERIKLALSTATTLYKKHFLFYICSKVITFGLILHLVLQQSSLIELDENTSLTLLIGQDILDGNFSAFRYGHNFAGTAEYLVIAPLVAIFSISNTVTKIIGIFFLILTSVLIWKGFERTPYKDKMRIAMALLWIWPGYFVFTTSNSSGYLSALILVYAGILFSSYYAAHSLINKKFYFLFAFLSGLALWIYPLSIIFTFVCLLWIRRSSPTLKQLNLRALSIFILGSLLWWAKTISDRGNNLFRFFENNVGPTSTGFSNNGNSLLTFLDIKTTNNKNFVFEELNLGISILYIIAIASVITLLIFGIKKALQSKRTDFAHLAASLVIAQITTSIIFWVLSIKLGPTFYLGLVIPLCFLVVFSLESKMILILGINALLIASGLSLIASTKTHEPVNTKQLSAIEKTLQSKKISTVIATHRLSYPIVVESDNTITANPFDYNAFDIKRAQIVQKEVEAIVVEQNDKKQNDIALCVQGAFSTGFEKINIQGADIYIVPKDLQSKIWKVTQLCNQRS